MAIMKAITKQEADRWYKQFKQERKATRTPQDNVVYHYTSLASLQKIVETTKIFATDYRLLNDKTEFQYGLQVLEVMLRRRGQALGHHFGRLRVGSGENRVAQNSKRSFIHLLRILEPGG